ncbi:MAG TPA: hypothetical protein VI758_10095 [Bacteroidota bacterium]
MSSQSSIPGNPSAQSLGIKLFAWCIAILIVSVLVLTFRGLYPLELTLFDFELRRPVYPRSNVSTSETPVRVLTFWSQKDATERYFRHVLEIVGKLNRAGARVVLVPVPPSTTELPEIQAVVRRIAAFDIVVFGDPLKSPPQYGNVTDKEFDAPDNWWAPHPMNNLVNMDWGVSSARTNERSSLIRFVPNQYRESMKGYTVPDVALLAVKKFEQYPDNVGIVVHPTSVVLGKYHIPIWDDGYAYVRTSFDPFLYPSIFAFEANSVDSLRYDVQPVPWRRRVSVDSAWAEFTGKIVIINWAHMTDGLRWQWMGYGVGYAQVIKAILSGTFARRYNQWDLAIVFLIIILAGALVFTVRTWIAVLVFVSGGLLTLAGSLWLFRSYDIIEDPVYLLLTIVLCTCILPLVKLSHEKGYFKKELEDSRTQIAILEQQIQAITQEAGIAKERSSASEVRTGQ